MAENSITLYRGAAATADTFFAIGYFDDLEAPGEPFPRMRLVQFDRASQSWDILTTRDWSAAAITAWQDTSGTTQIAVAGTNGEVLTGTPNDLREETVDDKNTLRLSGITGMDAGLAVAGAASAAYVRSDSGAWQSVSDGVSFGTMAERLQTVGQVSDYASVEAYMAAMNTAMEGYETFNAVAGIDPSAILFAGDRGRLAYWNGDSLHVLENDITVNFAQITANKDGWIVVGFAPTTLVVFVDRKTRIIRTIAADTVRRTLTGVTLHHDKVVVSGLAPLSAGLLEVGPDGLTPFGGLARNTWSVQSTSTGLWALGEKEVHFLADNETTTFASPFL